MSQEKSVTQQDFQSLKDKVDWVEIQGAAVVTRKTMWFVKEGCRWVFLSLTDACGGVLTTMANSR